MCLNINKKIHSDLQPKIATEDIYTLKLAENIKKTKCNSFFENALQKYNVLLTSKLVTYNFIVEEGLHSIINIDNDIDFWFDRHDFSRGVILCKIPKDSKYYIGNDGDIVSNQLILLQPILCNDASKYKLNTDIKSCNWTKVTSKKFWEECFKIVKDLGYKIGI